MTATLATWATGLSKCGVLRRVPRIKRSCPICAAGYETIASDLKWGRGKTCSYRCGRVLSANLQRGTKRVGWVKVRCNHCGLEFERLPSESRDQKKTFCSAACQAKGSPGRGRKLTITESTRSAWQVRNAKGGATRRKNGWRMPDATKAKLSLATVRAYAAGKFKSVSKAEDQAAEFVAGFGLRYERQHRFFDDVARRYCIFDFWFPEQNAILEFHGTYWHADPRVYQGDLSHLQRDHVARDVRKRACLDRCGMRLVVVWEKDFRENPAAAMEAARRSLLGIGVSNAG